MRLIVTESVAACIRTQHWPCLRSIHASDSRMNKRKGIYLSGRIKTDGYSVYSEQHIALGTIVCDYPGDHTTAEIGLAHAASVPIEDSNYVLYYRNHVTQKDMCVDAITCCRHGPEICNLQWPAGRLINHSVHPNVESRKHMWNDHMVIFIVAIVDIQPFTEVTMDYGVRTATDGSYIDWLRH